MQRHEANWKLLRHPLPILCPWPAWAEGCPSAQTMVEEAALAAFPSCSLGSWGSTQARARFSSWIHMKHPRADFSLPPCSGSCHGSGTGAHKGNRGAKPRSSSRAGNTMRANKERGCVCCLPRAIHSCLEPISSFQEPLDLQLPLLGTQSPKPRGWILMPLQIKPAKHWEHRARAVFAARL